MAKTITIFTKTFCDDNYSEIARISKAGNLSPIQLTTVDGARSYMSAVACAWNAETTNILNDTLPNEEKVLSALQSFEDLKTETIEAFTLSIKDFLILEKRPEFNYEPA